MKLPNREKAYVPRPESRDYLPSETHTVGRARARFFRTLGPGGANLDLLEQRLIAIARGEDVTDVASSLQGTRRVIEGALSGPIGAAVRARTVWIVDAV